jgi:hypothetical protein
MTSQRWSTFVSGLVLTLALASGGPARAQWGFPGTYGQFGQSYGTVTAFGISPYDYGSFGGASFGGSIGIGASQLSYFDLRNGGPKPQATTSFQSVSNVITLVPGWGGPTHRVRRVRQDQAQRPPRRVAAMIAGR